MENEKQQKIQTYVFLGKWAYDSALSCRENNDTENSKKQFERSLDYLYGALSLLEKSKGFGTTLNSRMLDKNIEYLAEVAQSYGLDQTQKLKDLCCSWYNKDFGADTKSKIRNALERSLQE